jgi:hypothetical protein
LPAGSENLVSGAYTGTLSGVALGVFEGDAGLPALEHTRVAEDVGNTSFWAKSVIDSIEQGGNIFISFTCIEWGKAAVRTAFWPYNATLGRMPTVGVLLFDSAVPLVLTAVAGTPAATQPATLTASKVALMPGFTPRIMFGPTLRRVPLRFRCFPFSSGGNNVWFTVT